MTRPERRGRWTVLAWNDDRIVVEFLDTMSNSEAQGIAEALLPGAGDNWQLLEGHVSATVRGEVKR